jgi:exopolysaccharide biosynthesis polyprenyl glycosylphosphotransferase
MFFRRTTIDYQWLDAHQEMVIPNYDFNTSLLIFPFFCLFIHSLSGIYLHPEKHRQSKIFTTTLLASAIIAIAIFFVLVAGDIRPSSAYYHQALLVLWGMLFFVTYFFRTIICHIMRKNYKTGKWTTRTAIIGTGENAKKIAGEVAKNMPENTLLGFIAEDKQARKTNILGRLPEIDNIIKKENIQEIIIAIDDSDENRLFSIINSLYHHDISIRFMPSLYEILIGGVKINELGVSPLVTVTSSSMKDWETCVKRFFDIVLSFAALLVLLPLFAFIAIRIKMDSKGTVFFSQERIGQFGKAFNILKFRTMYANAENGIPQLSTASDNRVTRFGRFLRKYRLDELPQFWNVLKGEMSIVGPRPERDFYIKKIMEIAPYYCLIYKIRPGLTSWGPIRIGYSDTIEKMVERLNYDIIYMENMSLKTDIKILLFTIEVIFRGKGI